MKGLIREKGQDHQKSLLRDFYVHSGPEQPRIQTAKLGHSLVRLLVRSHCLLVRLLRTARFARALRCAYSLARSLAHFVHSLAHGKVNDWMGILSVFFSIFDHSDLEDGLTTV